MTPMVFSTQMTTAPVTNGYGRMDDLPGASFSHVGRMGAPVGARMRAGPSEWVATCVTGGEAARRQAAVHQGSPARRRRFQCTGTTAPFPTSSTRLVSRLRDRTNVTESRYRNS
ncbi:hypothetical protein HEK616_62780 [Streptomyces nigrescens]|uniref:Uncharacterized protein n=1 Tax=Streptomyces nigrescens TaxID=1920 RepID=A0ABN6R7F1_STRNI|nr:hypothetical protein HEK616_62780 [Streptomyces nigrescens]